MIEHTCGTTLPATVEDFVRHLAACDETSDRLGPVVRQIVAHVDQIAALDETQPVSVDVSPAVSRDTAKTSLGTQPPSIDELAVLRDGGMSYRDLANVSGVAPETVRRRLARHAAGSES